MFNIYNVNLWPQSSLRALGQKNFIIKYFQNADSMKLRLNSYEIETNEFD